jgi:hypothetical protein
MWETDGSPFINKTMKFKDILTERFPSIVIVEEPCMMAYADCFCVTSNGKDSKGFPLISISVGNSDELEHFLFEHGYFSEFVSETELAICKE